MGTSKYLRYAVGEVILVVIGILIALQFNNLNEAKKYKKEQKQFLTGLKDELILAIAEAAQNIVKHAFKNNADANELMVVQISCENKKLQIAFYDRGTPVDPKKVKHREIDNVKPGGLGTFFIQEIMDAVEFKDGKKPWINHLVLTKQLT